MKVCYNRFSVLIPAEFAECLRDATGDVSDLVEAYVNDCIFVYSGSNFVEALRDELREYGAWDAEELSNHDENVRRMVWIAGGDVWER